VSFELLFLVSIVAGFIGAMSGMGGGEGQQQKALHG